MYYFIYEHSQFQFGLRQSEKLFDRTTFHPVLSAMNHYETSIKYNN